MGDEYVLRFEWSYLDGLLGYMDDIRAQGDEINDYVQKYVCNKEGFGGEICVLHPLGAALDAVGDAFDTANTTFKARWNALMKEVAEAGVRYTQMDGSAELTLNDLLKKHQDDNVPYYGGGGNKHMQYPGKPMLPY